MKFNSICVVLVLPVVFSAGVLADTIAPVKIDDLFAQADLVAIVKVQSGDTENYDAAVYKAEVTKAFKGTKAGVTIYLGPFTGMRLGNEYLVFLKKAKGLSPKQKVGISYGEVSSYFRGMYEGYSILEINYACIFDGTEIREQCDDGVVLNPSQIVLPRTLKTFPPGEAGSITNYKKWVRLAAFIAHLNKLQKPQPAAP